MMFKKIEKELLILLHNANLTLSVAESCTGGLVSKRITDVPGSSLVFKGGIIAYNNEVKIEKLSVPEEDINTSGAVSEIVAIQMARGARVLFNSDIGLSITGIAGPGGGSPDKPVGTVCFGFAIKDKVFSIKMYFKGSRKRIRNLSSDFILKEIIKYLV